jgi:hypothetical protein
MIQRHGCHKHRPHPEVRALARLEGWLHALVTASFETPRKGAAPQDDELLCALHYGLFDRFPGVAEIMCRIDERDVGQRLREIPDLAPLA